MTPVQASAIPLFLSNKDVVAEAVTGSGKTLAFLVPVIEILLRRETPLRLHQVGAIIIEPTRELAKQVVDVLELLVAPVPQLPFLLLTGGNALADDVEQFRRHGAAIVVATPGRLNDIMTKVAEFSTKELDVLVLDEADRACATSLLDMGFERTITSILARLPKQRRTRNQGLFSATMTEAVTELVRAGLRNAVRVTVKVERVKSKESQRTPSHLTNRFLLCESDQKLGALLALLAERADDKVIVYFATCACVDFYSKALQSLHMLPDRTVVALHGKMEQKKRSRTAPHGSHGSVGLAKFAASVGGVLFCTDVAARGLDIPDVDCVIQYDPPQDPNGFVHRCGRTARLGKEGRAILFLLPTEESYVEVLRLRKAPLSPLVSTGLPDDLTSLEPVAAQLKDAIRTDRDLMDKSLRAFVSFVRSYKEHVCHFIFRLRDLNYERLARAFGLFRLPRMPELRDLHVTIPVDAFDTDLIPYLDKKREQQRKQLLLDRPAVRVRSAPSGVRPTAAWSHQQERKRKRDERLTKKERKREAIAAAKAGGGGRALGAPSGPNVKGEDGADGADDGDDDNDDVAARSDNDAEGGADEDEDDAAELARDYRLIKRRRRGRITEKQFEKAFADLA